MQAARHDLEAADDPRLGELAGQLQQASVVLADVGGGTVRVTWPVWTPNPARLQEVLARQAALRALTRRYGEDVDAVLRVGPRGRRSELVELDSSDDRLAELQTGLDDLRRELGRRRRGCRGERSAAADRLGRLVTKELDQLAMARAVVRVRVEPAGRGAGGSATRCRSTAAGWWPGRTGSTRSRS